MLFRVDTLREIELMYLVGHNAHILHLIGHAYIGDKPLLVLEFCANGDLLGFLRNTPGGHLNSVSILADYLIV